jgi:hypothetical protein
LKVNKGNKLKKIQKEMNNGKFGNLIPRWQIKFCHMESSPKQTRNQKRKVPKSFKYLIQEMSRISTKSDKFRKNAKSHKKTKMCGFRQHLGMRRNSARRS